jgi:hypothetical protein
MVDNDSLVLVNVWWEPLTFTVPANLSACQWSVVATPTTPNAVVPSAMKLASGNGHWSSCTRRPETYLDLRLAQQLKRRWR